MKAEEVKAKAQNTTPETAQQGGRTSWSPCVPTRRRSSSPARVVVAFLLGHRSEQIGDRTGVDARFDNREIGN